jgi:hypothetical protein
MGLKGAIGFIVIVFLFRKTLEAMKIYFSKVLPRIFRQSDSSIVNIVVITYSYYSFSKNHFYFQTNILLPIALKFVLLGVQQ